MELSKKYVSESMEAGSAIIHELHRQNSALDRIESDIHHINRDLYVADEIAQSMVCCGCWGRKRKYTIPKTPHHQSRIIRAQQPQGDDLTIIQSGVSVLKSMAENIGNELDESNRKLDRINAINTESSFRRVEKTMFKSL